MNPPHDDLSAALARHQIEMAEPQIAMLSRYCDLLWQVNEKLNLTRHTDYEKFVARDVVDSLAFAQFLKQGERVLDVGTGGGVPGIVLAIVRDDLDMALSESVGKKARAVGEIVATLGLDLPVIHGRAENFLEHYRFDTLVVRAVAKLKKLLEWFEPCWDRFDRLLVLKGPAWVEERGEARHYHLLKDLALRKLATYPIPETHSESVLLQICPKEKMA